LTEQGFENLVAAHRKGFEVIIMVDDIVTFALPAEIRPASEGLRTPRAAKPPREDR
jgi:hypothetical protein